MVYQGFSCGCIMFEGQVESSERINLLYDDVHRHYHVITNLTGAMARRYVCKACNKGRRRDLTHVWDQMCSECMARPPCEFEGVRIPCDGCSGHFRSRSCFDNHKRKRENKKKLYASASDIAVRVEDSLHAKITSVTDDIFKI